MVWLELCKFKIEEMKSKLELEKEAELLSLRLRGAYDLGYKEGYKEGYAEGYAEVRAERTEIIIKYLMSTTSMSQKEIAEIAEVPESFVSKIFN